MGHSASGLGVRVVRNPAPKSVGAMAYCANIGLWFCSTSCSTPLVSSFLIARKTECGISLVPAAPAQRPISMGLIAVSGPASGSANRHDKHVITDPIAPIRLPIL